MILPVYNRFDHTNLNEVKVRYTYNNGVEKEAVSPVIEPHQKDLLVIPSEDWKAGSDLLVSFLDADNELIDAFLVTLGQPVVALPQPTHKGALQLEETSDRFVVKGNGFEIPFSKETGLIDNATVDGKTLIEKGPFLNLDINLNHLTGAEVRKSATKFITSEADWKKENITCEKRGSNILVSLTGSYRNVRTDIRILISSEGKMEINYLTDGQPNGFLRETGLSFYLPETIDQLSWKRKGHWSYYPAGEFAGNEGSTSLYNPNKVAYGARPDQPWADDTHDYYYWADAGANCDRPLTRKAKGMKENIYFYTLSPATGDGLSVISPVSSKYAQSNAEGI